MDKNQFIETIEKMSVSELNDLVKALEEKFGNNAKLYGSGMLQLLGPWAPHIAIHGTNDNSRIGKYSTNGCINLANENLEWLLSNAGIGSKVYVYDSKANN